MLGGGRRLLGWFEGGRREEEEGEVVNFPRFDRVSGRRMEGGGRKVDCADSPNVILTSFDFP